MAAQNCGKCEKAVYATEKIEAAQKWYHKGCFKCSDGSCNIQLNLKTFQVVNDTIWCAKHAPKPQATTVADDAAHVHAMQVPKKSTEGLHRTQVGTGEKPNIGLDSVTTQHALTAPKKTAENLHRVQVGTGEKPNIGLDSVTTQHALTAPKKTAENLHKVQVGTGENYKYGLDTVTTQHALNAPKKQSENLGTVKKGDAQVPRGMDSCSSQVMDSSSSQVMDNTESQSEFQDEIQEVQDLSLEDSHQEEITA